MTPNKLHPVAFFSTKLSPAEPTCDTGNRELLAVTLALEQWWHWLEGALLHFLVLTDHKKIFTHSQATKPCQLRWALLFIHFHFTVSYWPGTKNTTADALSWVHSATEEPQQAETILPKEYFLNAVMRESNHVLARTLFGPRRMSSRTKICPTRTKKQIDYMGTHLSSYGMPRDKIYELLPGKYWWPNMIQNINRYISSCSTVCTSQGPRTFSVGKHMMIPTPQRPWLHLPLDLLIDLPEYWETL